VKIAPIRNISCWVWWNWLRTFQFVCIANWFAAIDEILFPILEYHRLNLMERKPIVDAMNWLLFVYLHRICISISNNIEQTEPHTSDVADFLHINEMQNHICTNEKKWKQCKKRKNWTKKPIAKMIRGILQRHIRWEIWQRQKKHYKPWYKKKSLGKVLKKYWGL
jgi:hypothetical protein